MPKGGLSSFFYGKFVVSGTEKLRRGTHLCFTEFSVSKNFRNKRVGEVVSVTIFRQNGFCLTVSNHFVEETFCVSESFGFRKLLGTRVGAGITIFRQNCFCLTVPNHFLEETFCVSESFGYRKGLCLRGGLSSFFYRVFDVSEYRKTSKRNPSVFHRVFCIERFYEKEGGGRG